MDARRECSPMTLALAAGQVQRVLVEAGSTLLVTQGTLTLRLPFAWLAGKVVVRELPLLAETTYPLEDGGWVDLEAVGRAEAVILPPESAGPWAKIGQMLAVPLGRRAGKFPEKSVA